LRKRHLQDDQVTTVSNLSWLYH